MRLTSLGFVLILSSFATSLASAQELGVEKKQAQNAVYVELGGNGAWYSVNYERYLRKDASVRIGAMYMSVEASAGESSASASWLAVPIMFNYLGLAAGNHALELGAGLDVMHFSGGASSFDATAEASGIVPVGTATVGYRYASNDGGFLFRAGYTPLFFVTTEPKQIFHWGGMSFGYRF
jgi:hypothetical protein